MKSKGKDSSIKAQYISIFLCWLTYTTIYFGRYSYNANITLIESSYQVSHRDAGLVITFFSIGYGLSQFFHGIMCKRYSRKYVVPIAVTVAGVINLLIYFGIPFFAIKYFWFISALVQALLWPMMLQIISENVEEKLMNKAIMLMSTTTSCGTLLVYGISALFAKNNFRATFLFGTIVLFAVAITWLILYKPGNFLKNESTSEKSSDIKIKPSVYVILPICLLILLSIIINFGKDGLQAWVPAILKSTYGLNDNLSIILTLVLPIFGIFGASFAVVLNKKIKRVISLLLFFCAFITLFEIAVTLFQSNLVIMLGSFGMLELLFHGSCSVITTLFPLSVRNKFNAGTLTGLLNGSAYIGSAVSSYGLGAIADASGWNAVFITLIGTMVAAILFCVVYRLILLKNKNFEV